MSVRNKEYDLTKLGDKFSFEMEKEDCIGGMAFAVTSDFKIAFVPEVPEKGKEAPMLIMSSEVAENVIRSLRRCIDMAAKFKAEKERNHDL